MKRIYGMILCVLFLGMGGVVFGQSEKTENSPEWQHVPLAEEELLALQERALIPTDGKKWEIRISDILSCGVIPFSISVHGQRESGAVVRVIVPDGMIIDDPDNAFERDCLRFVNSLPDKELMGEIFFYYPKKDKTPQNKRGTDI